MCPAYCRGVVILKGAGTVGWLMSEEGAHELRDLVDDILETSSPKKKKKIKAKGMLLGERRDNGDIVQIDKMVLARHAAMLGSTGSGKTVNATSMIGLLQGKGMEIKGSANFFEDDLQFQLNCARSPA